MDYDISVVIPVYNTERYIERCAHSLFKQTLKSIEFIFIDDCSPDNSIQILLSVLNKYPKRIPSTQIIRHKTNKGLAVARNTGRAVAHGKYIIDCDSDDWIDENMYEELFNKAEKENADIVICDYYLSKGNNRNSHVHVNPPLDHLQCVSAILTGQVHAAVWNKLIKRNLYVDFNISCTEGINYLEDLSTSYKLFYYAQKVSYLNKPLYYYFQSNNNSYTSISLNEQSQNGMILLLKQISNFIQGDIEEKEKITQAFKYTQLNIKSTLLLNKTISQNIPKFHYTYSILDIIQHPVLALRFKIVLIFDVFNFNIGIKILRYIKAIKTKS